MPDKLPVFFDHDGGVDDLLSLLLLLTMPRLELLGVSITPADCFAEPAFEATHKLLRLLGQPQVPVSVGQYHGVNAFPPAWRAAPRVLNALPALLRLPDAPAPGPRPGPEALRAALAAAPHPVTVLLTGPCSTLVQALEPVPALAARIGQVVWMGGAVDVPGNVRTYNQDGSAEWNAFWDPPATARLLALGLPLTLVPLDVTNQVPVGFDFLRRLAAQAPAHPLSELAGQFWATTVATIPTYEYTYFMWDVLATSYLAIPAAFAAERLELAAIPDGPAAGRTVRQPGSGQWVQVLRRVDTEAFYAWLLGQLTFHTQPRPA